MDPASIAGLVMGVFGTLNTSVGIINGLVDRCKNNKKLRERCEDLRKLVENMRKKLEPYVPEESPKNLPPELVGYLKENKGAFGEVEKALKNLVAKMPSSPSMFDKGRKLWKANEWTNKLEDLKTRLNMLNSTLLQLSIFTEVRGEIGRTGRNIIEGVSGGLQIIGQKIDGGFEQVRRDFQNVVLKDTEDQGSKADEFSPCFYVPENPSGVIIDFDDPRTMEAQLKEKLLDKEGGVVAAVSVVGMGGVGKSCALRALGRDVNVKERFKHGFVWMQLGKDANDFKFVKVLAEAVSDTGGFQLGAEIRGMSEVERVVKAAAEWFAGRCVLFLCDDLWSHEGRKQGYFKELKRLVDESSGSRMLCSTRDCWIAKLAGKRRSVHFPVREEEEARRMIRKYAEFEDDDVQGWEKDIQEAFESVTSRCGGLPLALSIAGSAVADLASIVEPPAERHRAWKHYKERLERVDGRVRQLIKPGDQDHLGLLSALEASLEVADRRIHEVTRRDGISALKMFRALCVLRKQEWAPSFVLAQLWDVRDDNEAAELMSQFKLLSLVETVLRDFGTKKEKMGLKLHDLVHDFCCMEATEEKEVEAWHKKVLEGYASGKIQKGGEDEGRESNSEKQWYFEVKNDGYIHENLARHLVESKEIPELQKLLLDFKWTAQQLEVNGLLALETDFDLLVANLSPKRRLDDRALRMIAGAARLSLSGNVQSG